MLKISLFSSVNFLPDLAKFMQPQELLFSFYDTHAGQDTESFCLRSEVLTVVTTIITVFWDVTPCSLVGHY
jgi:hypothetical protein